MEDPKPVTITLQPLNDQVLVKLDTKERSALDVTNDKPIVFPSGRVIAVGRGTFLPGVGFQPPQVKAGDHVALDLDRSAKSMPISPNKSDCYVLVSEALILGRLEGAEPGSCWFNSKDDEPTIVPGRFATK